VTTNLPVVILGPPNQLFRGRLKNVSLTGAGIECAFRDGMDRMAKVELLMTSGPCRSPWMFRSLGPFT